MKWKIVAPENDVKRLIVEIPEKLEVMLQFQGNDAVPEFLLGETIEVPGVGLKSLLSYSVLRTVQPGNNRVGTCVSLLLTAPEKFDEQFEQVMHYLDALEAEQGKQ